MAEQIGLQKFRDFSGGMVTESSESLTPPNVMRLIMNFDEDVVGSLRVRPGVTAIGNQVQDGKVCLGLYNFRDSGSGGNNQQLAAFNNSGDSASVIYYNNSGTWTATSGGTSFAASKKFRFTTFLDYVFTVNTGYDAPKSWNGDTSTAWGSTNLSSAPSGKLITVFNSRLYIGATSAHPDRVYKSSIPTAGAITWDTDDTTGDWIDINPSDGMNLTAFANTGTLILFFKERAMYRWNGRATDANLIVDIGTTSQENVASRTGRVYFFNPYGIYVTDGGYPVRISKPIHRWIAAIDPAYYTEVSAVTDEDHCYFSIGDVTVDGVAYTNVVLKFTFSTQTWSVRAYAEQIRAFANFIDSTGAYRIMCGNDDGDVQTYNLGSTDDGTPISYRVRTKKMDFGSYSFVKKFSDAFLFGNKLQGAELFIQSENNALKGQGWGLVGWFRRLFGMKNRGRYFVFEVAGISSDGQGELEGFEITDLAFDGYTD